MYSKTHFKLGTYQIILTWHILIFVVILCHTPVIHFWKHIQEITIYHNKVKKKWIKWSLNERCCIHRWLCSCKSNFLLLPVSLKGLGQLLTLEWLDPPRPPHPLFIAPSCPSPLLLCPWENPGLTNEEAQEEEVEGEEGSELVHVLAFP